MKITFLGTGCPEPSLRRASSGYLVEIAGDKIVFDFGGGVFDRLMQAGHRPEDIDVLVLSHLHSDHMMDYPRLVHAGWDAGKGLLGTVPLKLFGPAPMAEVHDRYFGANGALAFDIEARVGNPGSQQVWVERGGDLPRPGPAVALTEIDATWSYETQDWRITCCEVPHAQPHLLCLAFRIDCLTTGKSFVYSGDAARTEDLINLASGADLLLHWCYRLDGEQEGSFIARLSPSPSEIGQIAAEARVKRLALTHLRTRSDDDNRHAEILEHAASTFTGSIDIAEDLAVIELSG